jgi:hypothetical protein
MKISSFFNRFYHGVVIKQIKQLDNIKTDINYLGRMFEFSPKQISIDSLKQLLKAVNLGYPRDDKGKPLSTIDIENKELLRHIEYLIKLCGNNGDTLQFVEDEWERLKMEAGII